MIYGSDIEIGILYDAVYKVMIGKDHYMFVIRI